MLHFDDAPPQRTVLLGDFNHNIHLSMTHQLLQPWKEWLHSFCHDTFLHDSNQHCLPTFGTILTIDFILVTSDMQHLTTHPRLTYVKGCDHSALTICLTVGSVKVGPGIWRCNPLLMVLNDICLLKQQASRRHIVNSLQRRRQRLLRRTIDPPTSDAIATLEAELDKHYQDSASILALRSGHKWRELGERSNAYFYKCLKDRQQQQAISELVADDGTILSTPEELTNCAKGFYSNLYSTEPVSPQATDFLLSQLPDTVRLDDSQQTLLLTEWTDEEVEACLAHTPTHSSPGIDGLPYEILRFLFQQPFCRSLFCDVLNTALTEHVFPATWQRSVVTLLPKKGDRRHLKNWRPISLICADAKVFTRLLANRLGGIVPDLLIPHQTGFLAERFIADNGLVTRLTMDIARRYRLPGIALLLDQEKAYDRVHSTYLRACLLRFGFPTQFVECITPLFFNTSLCVKVNGFLSTAFAQERGLRQGDPLSPFLFNLALEPLLRAIHTCPLLPGFRFHDAAFSQMPRPIGRPPVLKLLAYADDVLVFLKDPIELTSLLALITAYELASNAKLNLQ
ncbi:hypothetical protein G6F57_012969 [Rhizopus arrhizus]|nr:hypothetical protein G6F30_012201 [Rhizopus arrhizus]KAG0974267.1 hypothetical protein G6F29_012314 [Rhizopus arrhizus]KAG0978224.1 hypothetical protein G6F28_012201 [Rhizopus arrhizus]KAG1002051.1 hypothetical protein G6F27_012313 [Rhizopus arrhizus]KAG1016821.1 hypothetical protein G6F26_012224 [Rhizopus arrhizus]